MFSGWNISTLSFRKINYYVINETPALDQTIAGVDLSLKIMKHFSLSVNFEGTFENTSAIHDSFLISQKDFNPKK